MLGHRHGITEKVFSNKDQVPIIMLHIYLIYCPMFGFVKNAMIYRVQYPILFMYIDIWIVWYCRWRAPQAPASSTVISTALSTTGQSNVNWQCQKPLDVCIIEIIDSAIGRLKPYSILLIFRGWWWLCVANGLCLLIAHQLCWERIGQRGEERGRDYGW